LKPPKRALTAYLIFCGKHRRRVMREVHPNKSGKFSRDEMQQVTVALANMWNNISPQEMAEVKAKAAEAKAEYELAKAAFEPNQLKKLARAQKKPKGIVVVEAVGTKPVRARTAYLIYCDQHRKAVMKQIHPDPSAKFTRVEMQSVTKRLAELWNRASAKEKDACKKQALKELEEYRVLKANYQPPIYGPAKKPAAVKASSKAMNKPKRPPTAYLLFAEELRLRLKQEEPTLDHVEVSKRISQAWKGIDLNLKKEYQRKADKAATKSGGERLPLMNNQSMLQGIEIIQPQNYHGMLEQ
jgi:hypothetical protein